MYAIVRTGGKQFRVEPGDTIYVERLAAPAGEPVHLEEVLLVADGEGGTQLGTPLLASAKVLGRVVEHGRQAKIRVFKYKRRKHYRRTHGHRQAYTALLIERIEA